MEDYLDVAKILYKKPKEAIIQQVRDQVQNQILEREFQE